MLGLDVGERRIGVAVCDADERVAVPLAIIDRHETPDAVRRVVEIARREGAERVVIGLPLSLDGTVGPQARTVQRFGRALEAAGVTVDYWDERLTTAQIERRPSRPPRRGERRQPLRRPAASDDLVAAAILQNYLDARRAGGAAP
ncbi:MAG TPA: Holliday junction resolvase RuvX [Dehalococcoidia bacterium]|nr:Holliday junction resolvase RuvX [Dehalococcoidia bacterium]